MHVVLCNHSPRCCFIAITSITLKPDENENTHFLAFLIFLITLFLHDRYFARYRTVKIEIAVISIHFFLGHTYNEIVNDNSLE